MKFPIGSVLKQTGIFPKWKKVPISWWRCNSSKKINHIKCWIHTVNITWALNIFWVSLITSLWCAVEGTAMSGCKDLVAKTVAKGKPKLCHSHPTKVLVLICILDVDPIWALRFIMTVAFQLPVGCIQIMVQGSNLLVDGNILQAICGCNKHERLCLFIERLNGVFNVQDLHVTRLYPEQTTYYYYHNCKSFFFSTLHLHFHHFFLNVWNAHNCLQHIAYLETETTVEYCYSQPKFLLHKMNLREQI